MEAAAQAEDVGDLFRRLEACGQLVRIDPEVEPTMYRCASISLDELEQLRSIECVVRHGRVVHLGTDRIELDGGSVRTDTRQVHVDCSAAGLRDAPSRPIFEPGTITLQQVRACQPTFNAALMAFVEAHRGDDAEKNRLCPPNRYPTHAVDWIAGTLATQRAQAAWSKEPDLKAWLEGCRLNASRGIRAHVGDARMRSALTRLGVHLEPALANLGRLAATGGR